MKIKQTAFVLLKSECLKEGDVGKHVPVKFSLVCVKFWSLNAKQQ